MRIDGESKWSYWPTTPSVYVLREPSITTSLDNASLRGHRTSTKRTGAGADQPLLNAWHMEAMLASAQSPTQDQSQRLFLVEKESNRKRKKREETVEYFNGKLHSKFQRRGRGIFSRKHAPFLPHLGAGFQFAQANGTCLLFCSFLLKKKKR